MSSKNIKGSLTRSVTQKKSSQDRFAQADRTMEQGGYAHGRPASTPSQTERWRTTSFRASEAEHKRLMNLRAQAIGALGESVSNSDLVRAGLTVLADMEPEQRHALIERIRAE